LKSITFVRFKLDVQFALFALHFEFECGSKQEKKYSETEALARDKTILECVRANLDEAKNLQEAKDTVDDLLMLVTLMEQVEKGEAETFLKAIERLVKTDPERATLFAIHGKDMAEQMGLN
jgi:hypothetical protein